MLVSYRGVVKNGKVEIPEAHLPDGSEVLVVAQTFSSIADQQERLASLSDAEWQRPFIAYSNALKENPAEADLSELPEQAINELIYPAKQRESSR
jgi:hypothetical protein